jgi:hypothetical protein
LYFYGGVRRKQKRIQRIIKVQNNTLFSVLSSFFFYIFTRINKIKNKIKKKKGKEKRGKGFVLF